MEENEKYYRLGIAYGLNMVIKTSFRKLWDTIHAEIISQHDAVISVAEDVSLIEEMLEEQQKQLGLISNTAYEPKKVCDKGCKEKNTKVPKGK